MTTLYPLKFKPQLKAKIWGGDKIQSLLGQHDPHPSTGIGEAWLLGTDSSVEDGVWAGQKLGDLVKSHASDLLGQRCMAMGLNEFPLLIKFLDAREVLSVQVHPDDAYAQAHEHEPFGKCEVWYILEAEPDAKIVHGMKRPVTPDEVREALAQGQFVEMLDEVAVQAGDIILNLPGTVHAVGEGILLYELQQSSDLTYRFYDWERLENGKPRALHIEKSLDVAELSPLPQHKISPISLKIEAGERIFLAACRYFCAELLKLHGAWADDTGETFHILTVLEGTARLAYAGGAVELAKGETVLVPASLGAYRLLTDQALLAKAYVPDLQVDVIAPLLAAGIAADAIVQLGGDEQRSHLQLG